MNKFMEKTLATPLIAASSPATEKAERVLRLADHGVSGAILKSCADYVRSGQVAEKREYASDPTHSFLYVSSPFEKEILTLTEELELLKELRVRTGILLIPSYTAQSLDPNDWIPSCRRLEEAGADGIQLDFFYMGTLIGSDGLNGRVVTLLRELKKALSVPVMPKLNVNLPKDWIMPLLAQAGVEYVSLLDSVRSPYLERTYGGFQLSERLDVETTSCFGGWQLPLTLGYTYTAARYGLKICAGGGITCAEDAEKLMAAGASVVQSSKYLMRNPREAELILPARY